MKRFVFLTLIISCFWSCKVQQIKLKFVDEYILEDSIEFKNKYIGGLSGIDNDDETYYMVIDDAQDPRVVSGKINIEKDTISSIEFLDVFSINGKSDFFKNNYLDLESVFVKDDLMYLTSEGSVNKGKNPAVFSVIKQADLVSEFEFPDCFKVGSKGSPKHNKLFEASAKSITGKGFWVGAEGVIGADGVNPNFQENFSPVRITYYDYQTKKAEKQFAYPLNKLNRKKIGRFNVNGITAMLEYEENKFLLVERAYQSGYGINGNTVKIYQVQLNDKTPNTLLIQSLKNKTAFVVKKKLLFDFDDVRSELAQKIIDNVEGITFGPKLSNGNQSLILVSDDNFQKFGVQLNQFILLEMEE